MYKWGLMRYLQSGRADLDQYVCGEQEIIWISVFESTNILRKTKLVFNNKLPNFKKWYFDNIPWLKIFPNRRFINALQSKL